MAWITLKPDQFQNLGSCSTLKEGLDDQKLRERGNLDVETVDLFKDGLDHTESLEIEAGLIVFLLSCIAHIFLFDMNYNIVFILAVVRNEVYWVKFEETKFIQ